MLQKNILEEQDSYKIGMHLMYPPNTTEVYSFVESRGGMFKEMVVAGVNQFIHDYLLKPVTEELVQDLESFFKLRPEPFSAENVRHIVKEHNGYFPIEINALPEGTVIPVGTPFATVYNLDPKAYWVTTMIETVFLSYVWSHVSIATLVREMKKKLKFWNDKTSPGFEGIDYQLHNFGDRSAKPGFAKMAGTMHLISFNGTDCVAASRHIYNMYDEKDKVFGVSVPASEHSISTSWGPNREKDYVLHMINEFKDNCDIISIVGDTYNIYNFTEMVCTDPDIRSAIDDLASKGKKIVIRPDSGDATDVLPKMLDIITDNMAYTLNDANYKLLPPGIGIIWGDSITYESIDIIFGKLDSIGWASQNLVIGSGGYIVDHMKRDDLKFAMKASNVVIDSIDNPICKNPITAPWKKSKSGKFSVVMKDGTITWKNAEDGDTCILKTAYTTGKFSGFGKFQSVKELASI